MNTIIYIAIAILIGLVLVVMCPVWWLRGDFNRWARTQQKHNVQL